MIGHQTVSMSIYVVGMMFLIWVIMGPTEEIVKVLVFVGIVFTLMGIIWINYLVSANRLQPLINRIKPETHDVWVRFTKNNLLTFQVVKKGVYGQTKGIMQGKKADVVDRGDFPIRLINGNTGIIINDMMSHNVNLDHAVAWKKIYKNEKVSSSREAYEKAVEMVDNA